MKNPIRTPYIPLMSCLILMLFSSCNFVNNVKLLTGGSLEGTDFVETIPFEYKKDLIVVEARINGQKEKRKFIFDTGAFDSKIEIGLAEELRLPTKAKKSNSTAQGITQTIEVTQLEQVHLGDTKFSNVSAGKLEYDDESASRCIAPDGIIGANLMKLAHWRINYQSQIIQFSDQPFIIQGNEIHTLKFDKPLLSGTPEIELQVEGKTVSGVLFDVGYNGGLVLPARLSESFPDANEKKYYDRSTSGIYGTNTDTLISKKLKVSIGGHDMNIPVEFSSIGKALLGNDILEHFEVAIDYDKNKITLHPQSEIHVAPPYSFIPGMLTDSLWVVDRTTADQPFSLGDTLQSINGQRPDDLYTSFCDYFMSINQVLETDSLSIIKKDGQAISLISTNFRP